MAANFLGESVCQTAPLRPRKLGGRSARVLLNAYFPHNNIEDIPDHSFTLVLAEGNAFLNDSKLRYTFEDNCKSVDEVLL